MNQTRNGILITLCALIIFLIPFINIAFPIVFLFGIIEFYKGRKEFGEKHQFHVQLSLIILIILIIMIIVELFIIDININQIADYFVIIAEYIILMIILLVLIKIVIKKEVLIMFIIPLSITIILSSIYDYVGIVVIILLCLIYYYAYKEIDRYKIQLRNQKNITHTKEQVKEKKQIVKEFDYYCPSCLHQTNEKAKICPKCDEGRMLKAK